MTSLTAVLHSPPRREDHRRHADNADLWAACIAGAIPATDYSNELAAAGLELERVIDNDDYDFISQRAIDAATKYGVRSVSLLAHKSG